MKIRHFFIFLILSLGLTGCRFQQSTMVDIADDIDLVGEAATPTVEIDRPERNDIDLIEEPIMPGKKNQAPALKNDAKDLVILPDKLDHEMAFVSQAPYAVWDELHQEACEEASMIMVDKYFKGLNLTAHTMEQGILDLVKWQTQNDYRVDLTAQEAVDIINDYFGLTAQVSIDVTVERIKQELFSGKIIIVPAAGRKLGNPYFQTPGPIYHMLVIKGYDDVAKEFITNDPGTKRGKDFRYQYQKLISAIHDWDHELASDGMTDEEISRGRKVMILVSK